MCVFSCGLGVSYGFDCLSGFADFWVDVQFLIAHTPLFVVDIQFFCCNPAIDLESVYCVTRSKRF